MKYLLLHIFFFPLVTLSQVYVYNADLIDTSKNQLYQYNQNNVVINTKQKIGRVKFNNAVFEGILKNRYIVYPKKIGLDTLKVYSNGKVVYQKLFQIDVLPNPVARIGFFVDTSLSVNQILLNPFLGVVFPGTNYRGRFYISYFLMTAQYSNADTLDAGSGNLNRFSESQMNVIRGLKKGDKLHFPDIRGGGPDSRLQKLSPFTIEIK